MIFRLHLSTKNRRNSFFQLGSLDILKHRCIMPLHNIADTLTRKQRNADEFTVLGVEFAT
ncbi:hypothetical protein BX666DRAFT_787939 [Dichotomocladium elegans]|nr:hypothetical protein BX666DRAFT_787939 [Dichotomocladium elegans]